MDNTARSEILGELPFLVHSNCQAVDASAQFLNETDMNEFSTEPSSALLHFMINATPNRDLYEKMLENPDDYLARMTVTPVASLVEDDHAFQQSLIDHVPDTVNPVKARMVFVQVPQGNSVALELVWKVS